MDHALNASNVLNVQVKVQHFGYGFSVSRNGNIIMRIPVTELLQDDVVVSYYPSDSTIEVERSLEKVQVIVTGIIP